MSARIMLSVTRMRIREVRRAQLEPTSGKSSAARAAAHIVKSAIMPTPLLMMSKPDLSARDRWPCCFIPVDRAAYAAMQRAHEAMSDVMTGTVLFSSSTIKLRVYLPSKR